MDFLNGTVRTVQLLCEAMKHADGTCAHDDDIRVISHCIQLSVRAESALRYRDSFDGARCGKSNMYTRSCCCDA